MGSLININGKQIRPTWKYRDFNDNGTITIQMLESIRNVLEDIDVHTRSLNELLHCHGFIAIPAKLDAIKNNTSKRRKPRAK